MLLISRWRFGEIESLPTSIPRIFAISVVTFTPGKTPPFPGLAPWLNFISNIFTCGMTEISFNFTLSSFPSLLRIPYLAVPICITISQSPSKWYFDNPPSPVFIQQPASFAPLDRASTAGLDIAP